MKKTDEAINSEQSARVLEVLCTKYGFCLSPLWKARLINCPPSSADRFVRAVYAAEGLDFDASDSTLSKSVVQEVSEAFTRSSLEA